MENHRETGGVSGYVTIKVGGLGFRIAVLAGDARGTFQEKNLGVVERMISTKEYFGGFSKKNQKMFLEGPRARIPAAGKSDVAVAVHSTIILQGLLTRSIEIIEYFTIFLDAPGVTGSYGLLLIT